MSSGKLEKIFQVSLYENNFERCELSKVVIPFSIAFKSYKTRDIYSGIEKIPYKERDPDFKLILRHEFSDLLM